MSAYKTIECSFKDHNILIQSLKDIGWEPVVYKEKKNLTGYMNDEREQQAEIIVPRSQISNASNDLGFTFCNDKKQYLMICSDYDNHKGVADKVKQSYAVTAIKQALSKNKFSIKSELKNDNKIITITAGKII
jgi:hypothetical protein